MGPPPWGKRIIADERQLVTLIASPPGGGNRPHWHREFDEWWVVLAGTLEWELTGGTVFKATKDEIVWVPRGTVHHIRNVGDGLSLRLAVAMPPPTTTTARASSAATPTTGRANGARRTAPWLTATRRSSAISPSTTIVISDPCSSTASPTIWPRA